MYVSVCAHVKIFLIQQMRWKEKKSYFGRKVIILCFVDLILEEINYLTNYKTKLNFKSNP